MKKFISVLCVVVIILTLYFIRINYYETPPKSADYKDLKVHFLDVGQGDSCFIELPNNETVLIDSGVSKYANEVSTYIAALGVDTIDYLVATHGDADHIGGLYKIFENFNVESCFTSFVKSETQTYERFLKAVEDEGIELEYATSGEMILDEPNLDIEVLGPDSTKKYSDTNDASVVLLISFYEYDFLFTGDATNTVLESYNIGDIEVLKASHHGSRTGISQKLVRVLKPEYTIISAGINNRYNHPHKETIDALCSSKIYKTSDCGTITAICNEKELKFETAR